MKKIIPLLISSTLFMKAYSQNVIPLYRDSIPNSKPTPNQENITYEGDNKILIVHHISQPSLTLFLPAREKANGTAVIICPGGGYGVVAAGHEGYEVAKKLNEWGIAAFVLKYRLPNDDYMIRKEIGPLQDAQKAIQTVREKAAEWNINPHKIGIMGFSAGGHLASTAGTHFENNYIENKENISLRPDFMVLIYPVISFSDSIGHIGSRDNLIGKNPAPELIREFSNECWVTRNTPPAFLVHAGDDNVVNVRNSIDFYEAEQRNNLPAALHIYPRGGHGFGMNNPNTRDEWMDRLKNWLSDQGF